jgi:hypothetical protein|tara:strand:+ start:602 stop:760 length:159 start_codon:yes stop_codon:yes gene_type:complete
MNIGPAGKLRRETGMKEGHRHGTFWSWENRVYGCAGSAVAQWQNYYDGKTSH